MEQAKILVIEDTKSIRDELETILTLEGMKVVPAKDGQEGVDLAKKENPDLILCDIMMPKKDGFEVYSELQHSDLRHTPFIFLTAKATTENIREGMILGADDYITKPFDIDLLINSVKSRLAKKEAYRKKEQENRREKLLKSISLAIPHELLTPLNGIIGMSSFLKATHNFNAETSKEFVEVIYESGNRLHTTIKKFIYYTEVELLIDDPVKNKSFKEEEVKDGNLFLKEICDNISEKYARNSDIKIRADHFHVKMFLGHFEVILINVLDNAFKFSEKGDPVKVDAYKEDEYIQISIQDNGIGLDENKTKELAAFVQFDREIMEQQGLGMGLITAKKLLEFYGGTLSWKKNADKGTTFYLSLLSCD